MLSSLYAGAAAWRRRWYERHPASRRRLSRPVVSVGALAAGGSGKTPVTALVAELLRDAGQRPAILSRGYRRRAPSRVVVVRDPDGLRADVDAAGDEPRMLAERLPGVSVVVSQDRYVAGRLAETRLGATVHVLDDGFQHLRLARDLDLVLVRADDLQQSTFPAGRLRERPQTARRADALIVEARSAVMAGAVAEDLGVATWFLQRRSLGALRPLAGAPASERPPGENRVLSVAGIADPERFRNALGDAGFEVVGALAFADHHSYTPADVRRISAQAVAHDAALVLTTEKDAVRLAPLAPFDFAVAAVPLRVVVEPADRFRAWLLERVAAAGGRG